MGKLSGKVAVVTGGNSGIGLATAKQFAIEGARVFITGRRKTELNDAVTQIGHGASGIQADVASLTDLDRVYATVSSEAGMIDVLFANAGVGDFAPLGAITEAHFDRIFSINVRGTLFTVQKALPYLRDGASVILTGSTAATTGTPAFSVYSASKAAIRSFARNWILDLTDRAIRINVLAPGNTSTPGWHDLAPSPEVHQEMLKHVETTVPLKRLAQPEEIARAAVFLASGDSSYVTGTEFFVDGGSAQI